MSTPTVSFDPNVAVAHLRSVDPLLSELIDDATPFILPLDPKQTLFLALAEAIVYQQLHGKAAATIWGRVMALMPLSPTPKGFLAISDEPLRAAGLSRSKMLAIQDLARRTLAGELPTMAALRTMGDEEIIQRLTTVRGIGRWTVEMLLIFRLGRPDVLPCDDLGVRRGYALTYGLNNPPAPAELRAHGERWRPYRTVASWYMWRAVELARDSNEEPA